MKPSSLIILIFLTLCLSLPAQKQMTVSQFEQEILRLTNHERSQYGLPALQNEPGLVTLARRHTVNMVQKNFFAHRDPWGDEVSGRKSKYYPELLVSNIGENLGKFTNSRLAFKPEEVVTGWMNSPTHRAQILDRDYTHIGIAIMIKGTDMFATQNFASPIVKLSNSIPENLSHKKSYVLRFDYLANQDPKHLGATLIYPDRKFAYKLSEEQEMVGAQPIPIKWVNQRSFEVVVPFLAGKGNYQLCFGFNGGYFPEGILLKAK